MLGILSLDATYEYTVQKPAALKSQFEEFSVIVRTPRKDGANKVGYLRWWGSAPLRSRTRLMQFDSAEYPTLLAAETARLLTVVRCSQRKPPAPNLSG